ncbi:dienelactone hydrolase family protein [Sphingobacteriaceae bacterium WQ 2009]|uniref:Dienelactone hydrolase family protein n=1 Tax=Rhinopithecimicrobium faecis TaxID=2820698 RepID=A0A8T4HBW9_9SPHI|nr:dienelactone hydrolase family protein [Sphingobacteriaceae bacterium WQ 2009]
MGLLQKNTSRFTLENLVSEPSTTTASQALVILLHGIGSNEQDLFALKDYLPKDYLVVSARAPIVVGINQFAWFSMQINGQERIINQEEFQKATLKLTDFIADIKREYSFDHAKIYLVGFSQGAIMSYAVALGNPGLVKGVVAIAGRLLPETKAAAKEAVEWKDLSVAIFHGTEDTVLPLQYALEAQNFLQENGLQPDFKSYAIGHHINEELIEDLQDWLQKH